MKRKSCAPYIVLPVLFLIFLCSYVGWIAYLHDKKSNEFQNQVAMYVQFLTDIGLPGRPTFVLNIPSDTLTKLTGVGDSKRIASAIEAAKMGNLLYPKARITPGIIMSITKHESSDGASLGDCDGLASAQAYPFRVSTWSAAQQAAQSQREKSSALEMLGLFKNQNLRGISPLAATKVFPDYSNWKGGCSGEVGKMQAIPSTFMSVYGDLKTLNGYSVANPYDDQDWIDGWIAVYLGRMGYDGTLDIAGAQKSLSGWNQSESWRTLLVTDAKVIDKELSIIPDGAAVRVMGPDLTKAEGLSWVIGSILNAFGALPEDYQAFLAQIDPESADVKSAAPISASGSGNIVDLAKADGLTLYDPLPFGHLGGYAYGFKAAGWANSHWGVDVVMGSYPWTSQPLYPLFDGTVTESKYLPQSSQEAVDLWTSGNLICIETKASGHTWKACSGHGNTLSSLKAGDPAKPGTLLYMTGTTGLADGNHSHFLVMRDGVFLDPTPLFQRAPKSPGQK